MPTRYADSLIEDERQLIIEERQKNPNVKPTHLKATVNHNRALAGLPPLSKPKSINNALSIHAKSWTNFMLLGPRLELNEMISKLKLLP